MRKVIEGNVDLSNLGLTELFDLSDVEVTGHFFCNDNNLSSLVGAPSAVGDGFYCTGNNLDSLEGIPKEIVGAFLIDYNLKDKFSYKYILSLSDIEGDILYV